MKWTSISILLKVLVALSASLSAVSHGAAFGFTSQITYSFQHGNDQLLEMAIGEYVWIGMKEKCHCVDFSFAQNCQNTSLFSSDNPKSLQGQHLLWDVFVEVLLEEQSQRG